MEGERFQVLSLSGGGYRGLYTAAVLAALERATGRPIGQCFELIAGTSIGGIIALAVAFEIEMARVVQAFSDAGPSIFPRTPASRVAGNLRRKVRGYGRPSASASALRDVVEALIAKDVCLGDAKHPVVIPAVNLTEGRPQVFKTRHYAGVRRDPRLSAVEIALATSAAPTFFPPARMENCLYADGGLFANSPDLIALHEAQFFLGIEPAQVYMLSVGTTTAKYSIADEDGHTYGTGFWVLDDEHRLPNVLISAQQQFAEQITKHVLGERYLRIDTVPSHEQAPHLGLDLATVVATRTLMGLGEKAGADVLGIPFVDELLRHVAANRLLAAGAQHG